jgi:hypothetical protein
LGTNIAFDENTCHTKGKENQPESIKRNLHKTATKHVPTKNTNKSTSHSTDKHSKANCNSSIKKQRSEKKPCVLTVISYSFVKKRKALYNNRLKVELGQ